MGAVIRGARELLTLVEILGDRERRLLWIRILEFPGKRVLVECIPYGIAHLVFQKIGKTREARDFIGAEPGKIPFKSSVFEMSAVKKF